jgi:hypothetical protein
MKVYSVAEKKRQSREIMAKREYEERRNKWTHSVVIYTVT